MTDINKVFGDLVKRVADEFPELNKILAQAKDGSLSEEDAMRCLAEVVQGNPELALRFQQVAMDALAPLREEDRAKPLDHGGLVMHKETGLPRLNPLYEAALIERAQFDDDMPELRTGPKPQGVRPAVSVDTDVRDPVALGKMLDRASDQVAVPVAESDARHLEMVQQVIDGDVMALIQKSGEALSADQMTDLVLDGKTDMVDAPEYKRGRVPAPVRVLRPSGSALLAMTPGERRESAWRFLSTTQGRRSAIQGITELVEVKLRGEGFEVLIRDYVPSPRETVLAAHEWSVGIDGQGSTQSAFNLMDIAAVSIAKALTNKMGERRGRVLLEVVAVNTVDTRTVGWAGRLLSEDPLLAAFE